MDQSVLQYFALINQESEHQKRFYFDASDIFQTIQGVNRFYSMPLTGSNRKKFRKDYFDQDAVLIQTLLFGRYLGNDIRMLPTHQAELTRLISQSINKQNQFLYADAGNNNLKEFLEVDLDFHKKLQSVASEIKSIGSDEEIKNWIEEDNQDLLKAIFLSYKASYNERIAEIFETGIVKAEAYTIEDIEIYDDYLFNTLSREFSTRRSHRNHGGNNHRDVAALMYLALQVREYNADNTLPIPIYFDSNNLMQYIPDYILKRYFSIQPDKSDKDAVDSYALRDHNYFKYFALVRYNVETVNDDDKKYMGFAEYEMAAEKLQQESFRSNRSIHLPEVDEWYAETNTRLKASMLTYVEVDFYRSVIREIKDRKLYIINDALNNLNKATLNPESAEVLGKRHDIYLKHIDIGINDILRETVEMYTTIQQRVQSVMRVAERLKDENQELDVFVHYSLFRFLIPRQAQTNIRHFFSHDGLLSTNAELSSLCKTSLWHYYYRTVYYKHNTRRTIHRRLLDTNELYILYSSFWILSLHDRIIDFNSKEEYLQPLHHSLLMLIGASVDRSIGDAIATAEDPENGPPGNTAHHAIDHYKDLYRSIITLLEQRAKNEDGMEIGEEIAQIRIVLAYLYFRLWRQEGNQLYLIRDEEGRQGLVYEEDTANYKAVANAKKAFEFFKSDDQQKSPHFLYAFNIYVYFIIDTAPDNVFKSILAARGEFINLKGHSKNWHFRYNDTIARNFHRLSMMVVSREAKLTFIRNAINALEPELSKYAVLEARDINEVKAYLNVLQNQRGDLELSE